MNIHCLIKHHTVKIYMYGRV